MTERRSGAGQDDILDRSGIFHFVIIWHAHASLVLRDRADEDYVADYHIAATAVEADDSGFPVLLTFVAGVVDERLPGGRFPGLPHLLAIAEHSPVPLSELRPSGTFFSTKARTSSVKLNAVRSVAPLIPTIVLSDIPLKRMLSEMTKSPRNHDTGKMLIINVLPVFLSCRTDYTQTIDWMSSRDIRLPSFRTIHLS